MSCLAAAVTDWPTAVRAQQPRLVGVLLNRADGDAQGRDREKAFRQGLQRLGWSDGSNLRIEVRWGADDPELERRYADELVALKPEVILAGGSLSVAALQRATRTIPIVLAGVIDPVGGGFVESLARPGGNTTGFADMEYSTGVKWLEVLKQIAPSVTRVAVLRDPAVPSDVPLLRAIQSAAATLAVEVTAIDLRETGALDGAIGAFAQSPNGGLIVPPSAPVSMHLDLIVALARRYRLPAVYRDPFIVARGGLASYGPDLNALYRRSAEYVDRILKGEKPADLPVQAAVEYRLVINLRAAKAIGLEVPPSFVARADEVIE